MRAPRDRGARRSAVLLAAGGRPLEPGGLGRGGPGERLAHGLGDGGVDELLVAEAHLGLAGVDVDVDLLGRDLDAHERDRVAPGGHQRAVGLLDGVDERARGDGATVRDEVQVAPAPAVKRRRADQAADHAARLLAAGVRRRQAAIGGGGEEQLRDGRAVDRGDGVQGAPVPGVLSTCRPSTRRRKETPGRASA